VHVCIVCVWDWERKWRWKWKWYICCTCVEVVSVFFFPLQYGQIFAASDVILLIILFTLFILSLVSFCYFIRYIHHACVLGQGEAHFKNIRISSCPSKLPNTICIRVHFTLVTISSLMKMPSEWSPNSCRFHLHPPNCNCGKSIFGHSLVAKVCPIDVCNFLQVILKPFKLNYLPNSTH